MLELLEHYDLDELRRLANFARPSCEPDDST